jgi:small-conductance mechanosensitive channel
MEETSMDFVGLALKLVLSLAVVVVTMIAYRLIRSTIKQKIEDATRRQSARAAVRNVLAVVGFVVIALIWLPGGANLVTALGILRIGDRVRIGDVVGDVMDISLLRTTVMEVGEWVKADQYTGRVVTVANRAVWVSPVYNFTQHWGYLWDEITLPITYESDWQRAAEIMLEQGQTYTKKLQADAEAKLSRMLDRFPLKETKVEPTLYLAMTDNWIELTLRFVVDAQERRKVKGQLHRDLLQHIQAEKKIAVASTTIEIVSDDGTVSIHKGLDDRQCQSRITGHW